MRPWRTPRRGARAGGRIAILIAALAASGAALAQLDMQRLARLVETGRMQAAWTLAREHRGAHEGEPRFDLYYGIAAVETGRYSEGVFALRRVLAVQPALDAARLALARGYFALGDDRRARRAFERVLAQDPPAPVRARIERYLADLRRRAGRYRTAVSGYVEIGGGHDTNVNSATSSEVVDTVAGERLIQDIVLGDPEDFRELPDDFARVAGALRIGHPLTPGLDVFGELGGVRRYYDEHQRFELGGGGLRVGVVASGDRARTTLAVRAQRLYLDGERYRDTAGLDGGLRYALSDRRVAEVAARYARRTYDTVAARDSDLWKLTAGTTRQWRLPAWPATSLTAFYGEEDAHRDTPDALAVVERELYGVGGDLHLRLSPSWVLRAGLGYRRSVYAGEHRIFGEVREDDYHDADAVLEWRWSPAWRLQLHVLHAVNDSNLDFYDYDRSLAELRLRYRFYR